jgi:hypothetical protein
LGRPETWLVPLSIQKPLKNRGFCEREEIRTLNQRLKRPLLCR